MALKLSTWAAAALLVTLGALTGCGGGGGSSTPPAPVLSIEKTSLAFTAAINESAPAPQTIRGSISNLSSPPDVEIEYTTVGIESAVFTMSGESGGTLTVTPKTPALAGSGAQTGTGTYTDTITFRAYTNAAHTQAISGSPKVVTVTYTVNAPPPPAYALSSQTVQVLAGPTDAAPSAAPVTVMNIPAGVYMFVQAGTTGLQKAEFASTGATMGEVRFTFKAPSALGAGTYSDTVSLWACSDAAGTQEITGSRQSITVTYTISTTQITNLILNGDFGNGLTSWSSYTKNGAAVSIANAGGVLVANITKVGNAPGYSSDVQISSQSSLPCVKDRNYLLSFDAWADAPRSIETTIHENGHDIDGNGFAYGTHAYKSYFIGTSRTNFQCSFTMPVTNADAGMMFMVGQATGTLNIDNVSFAEVP